MFNGNVLFLIIHIVSEFVSYSLSKIALEKDKKKEQLNM